MATAPESPAPARSRWPKRSVAVARPPPGTNRILPHPGKHPALALSSPSCYPDRFYEHLLPDSAFPWDLRLGAGKQVKNDRRKQIPATDNVVFMIP